MQLAQIMTKFVHEWKRSCEIQSHIFNFLNIRMNAFGLRTLRWDTYDWRRIPGCWTKPRNAIVYFFSPFPLHICVAVCISCWPSIPTKELRRFFRCRMCWPNAMRHSWTTCLLVCFGICIFRKELRIYSTFAYVRTPNERRKVCFLKKYISSKFSNN